MPAICSICSGVKRYKLCNTTFKVSPYQFIARSNKKYCPKCYLNKSHGEVLIADFLNKNNIKYEKEKTFPDLMFSRFDFYLPELNIIFEFDAKFIVLIFQLF